MNNKKKADKKETSAVKISKRESGKAVKQNFMQNLREFPALPSRHPVEDLLFHPQEISDGDSVQNLLQNSDSENIQSDIGNPNNVNLATQDFIIGDPNDIELDSQKETISNPTSNNLATQIDSLGNPISNNLATQIDNFGNPGGKPLATKQPKSAVWQPKKPAKQDNLDAKQPKQSDLATQIEEKNDSSKFLKKYDKARSTKPLHTRISESVDNKIRHFIVDHEFTLKDFIEISATRFIDEFGNPNKNDLGGNQPYDDRRLRLTWKTKAALINLYLRYNLVLNPNSRWTVNDDDAACKFNECDFRLIELGIIQTQANKKFSGKIGSFGYYTNEIQNFVDLNLPADSIGIMLEINRKRWTQATGRELDLNFLNEIE